MYGDGREAVALNWGLRFPILRLATLLYLVKEIGCRSCPPMPVWAAPKSTAAGDVNAWRPYCKSVHYSQRADFNGSFLLCSSEKSVGALHEAIG